MKIATKHEGVITEHEIPPEVKVLVNNQSSKITPLDADVVITPKTTIKCMEDMSQKAWEFITTGPLFQYFFNLLFKDTPIALPAEISVLLEDFDSGVIHACGLIIQMTEAVFDGKKKVFIKLPETYLHPKQQYYLMIVLTEIQKLSGDDLMEIKVS